MSATNKHTAHLNEDHTRQINDFMSYFRSKRFAAVQEVQQSFTETKEIRLLDDMYNTGEVEGILDATAAIVKQNVQEDLENYTHQAALYLRQLYLQAEGRDITLKLDTSLLDDELLLSGICKLDTDDHSGLAESGKNKLGALNGGGVVDAKLVTRIKDLERQNDNLRRAADQTEDKLASLTTKSEELMQTNDRLNRQLDASQRDLQALQGDANAEARGELDLMRAQMDSTESNTFALQQRISQLESELNGKVSNTKQFLTLKKLIAGKNAQLKEARIKLRQYEQAPSDLQNI